VGARRAAREHHYSFSYAGRRLLIFQIIIVQVIAFTGLVLVLRKILISSSYKEINRLQQLNEENAEKSKELARKILDAENDHRERIAQAEKEARELKVKARREIEELKEALVAKGKAEGDSIVAQALNSKKEIRAEIEEEMHGKSVDLSRRICQKVLGSDELKLVFDGLLKNVLEELENIDKDRLKAIDLGEGSPLRIQVKASHAMNAQQKDKLETILSSKLDARISVQEVIDRDILSGIIIVLGSVVIDGSLSERFRKAAAEL
jgi:F-type H+-transporting ATPase subunit b